MKTRSTYSPEVTRRARRVQLPKDAYDLWYVLAYARGGPERVARRLRHYSDDPQVRWAIEYVRASFATPDSAGPVAVVRFEEVRGEEAERLAARVYAVAQRFLQGWNKR